MQRTVETPESVTACTDACAAPGETADGDLRLAANARALHRTLSDLLRVFQFRDRDRICCHDISVTQCYALGTLVQRGELTLNELAAELYLDKSTASRVVDALVTKGYATRTPRSDDRRAVALELTPAGRALYDRIDGELLAELRSVARLSFTPSMAISPLRAPLRYGE